ncbi:Cof-type HAD-IIB family hydrolase [Gorillibacterium massiliense]|uniref:Cof-type HAD-IIB family hydrolase n=1 Tax=Gorillibacterium massiliense TaxID=1280390 RepID=UPI0004B0EE56|nr:Cof-type HAD-IIB family hydrolase [Gorillibacterium massiliense]
MNHRTVVLDLDGTFLNSRKIVSERNLAAVLACHQAGMNIVFATARPLRGVTSVLPEALLQIASFIYYNGAHMVCPRTNIELHDSLPSSVTADIIDICLQRYPHLELSLEVRNNWYCLKEFDYRTAMNVNDEPAIKSLSELKQCEASKILLFGAYEGTPLYDEFHGRANILYTDKNRLIQVMPLNASKEQAVRKLISQWSCEMDDVIAFGDDFNDMGLFQTCGYAVAMGNAIPELKAVADEVTDSNDQDGVAVILEKILKEQPAGS